MTQKIMKKEKKIQEYLKTYCNLFDIEEPKAKSAYLSAVKHYNGSEVFEWSKSLSERWYSNLRNEGFADYDVYNEDLYFCELLACYKLYSSKYIDLIGTLDINPTHILDLGCGLGATTQRLKDTFGCKVTGTNLEGTGQFNFCREIGVDVIPLHETASGVDMIFASEYFEHIFNAGDHLIDVIETHNPNIIVMANAFNAESVGHFDYFYNGKLSSKAYQCDTMVENKKMGRMFSYILKNVLGYEKMDTGFWNNRPSVWVKK